MPGLAAHVRACADIRCFAAVVAVVIGVDRCGAHSLLLGCALRVACSIGHIMVSRLQGVVGLSPACAACRARAAASRDTDI